MAAAPSRPREPCAASGAPRRLELAAHVADEHVDDVGLDVGRVAPHQPQQLLAREHLARVAREDLQQVELAAGELEVAAAARGDVAARVDDHVADDERAGAGVPRRRSSACRRAVSSAIANGLTR